MPGTNRSQVTPVLDNPPDASVSLDQRLLFFTGKGGVGKSLLSAAHALNAADAGQRTLWIEMTDQPKGGYLFESYTPQYSPQEIKPNLHAMNLLFRPAIEEYLQLVFKVKWLGQRIARNRLFQIFTAALPGLYALVTLGKIWYEAGREERGEPVWDRIIVDAPATGHGLAWFHLPTAAQQVVQSGPIADRTRDIQNMLVDPTHSGIVVVTSPEKLVVDETLELIEDLHDGMPYPIPAVMINKVYPDLGREESERYHAWLKGAEDVGIAEWMGAEESAYRTRLRWYQHRFDQQQAMMKRLQTLPAPLVSIPWMPQMRDSGLLLAIQSRLRQQAVEGVDDAVVV